MRCAGLRCPNAFDQDDDLEAALVAAVRERTPGQSIPQALREHLLLKQTQFAVRATDPRFADFTRLVQETPALRDYAHRMWTRHEAALTRAIAEAVGASPPILSVTAEEA